MIGRRYKDRVEIEHFHPEILQIRELIQNTLQVSAVKSGHVIGFRQTVPVLHTLRMASGICIFIGQYIICPVTVAETVREYLIHHCAVGPAWHIKRRIHIEFTPVAAHIAETKLIKHAHAVVPSNLKMVAHTCIMAENMGYIIIEKGVGKIKLHPDKLRIRSEIIAAVGVFDRTEPDFGVPPIFCLFKRAVKRCSVRE